jgi:uncharacterized protein (UPF0276 family)
MVRQPLGFGVGLRAAHYATLRGRPPAAWGCDWFEALTENYLDDHGLARDTLRYVAAHRPVALHGVSLSIGGRDALDHAWLARLRALADEVRAAWVTDHLCWTRDGGWQSHDLLPIPYTRGTLAWCARRVDEVQQALGRPIALENPSLYVDTPESTLPEWAFMNELAQATGCGLLLDVNNVFVSCANLGWDPLSWVDGVAAEHVVQLHLAGPRREGAVWIDTHDQPVLDEVWALYDRVRARVPDAPVLLEWDAELPDFDTLVGHLSRARSP